MEDRDVIITASSCGGKMKCKAEAAKFKQPPIIVSISGSSEQGFANKAKEQRENSSILDNFFATKLKKIKPRRVCLISFNAGSAWTTEVLRCKKDIGRIDTIITIDGIHTNGLNAWYKYAEHAADSSGRLWMLHTQNKPEKGPSSKTTNTKIFNHAKTKKPNVVSIPNYITKLEKPVTVYSKMDTPHRKFYHSDPIFTKSQANNLTHFEYEGNKTQDQIYILQYVQPRLWNWLREEWTDTKSGITYET